jgi:hypothetical protein
MQALFLDQEMLVAAVRLIIGDDAITRRIESWLSKCCSYTSEYSDSDVERARLAAVAQFDDAERQIKETIAEIEKECPQFSRIGWKSYELTKEERDSVLERLDAARSELDALKETIKETGHKAAAARIAERIAAGQDHKSLYSGLSAQFEYSGWDVFIDGAFRLSIELKPVLGDDFPAVLRTIKGRKYEGVWRVLIVDRFDAEGASYDQSQAHVQGERH